MKKSILAIALLLVFAIGLAACRDSEPAADGGAADIVVDDGDLEAVTLDMRLIGSSQADIARISANVSEYLESIGRPYSIEFFIHEWGEWGSVVPMLLAAGEPIDLMFIANWAGDVLTQASIGTLRPLNDFLDQFPEIERILTADFMNASQVNGRNYALPVNKEKARQMGYIVREDIANQLGMNIDGITHIDQLEVYLYRAAEELNMWVLPWSDALDGYQFDSIADRFAIGTEPGSREVFYIDTSERVRNNVRRQSQWMEDGLMNPNITTDTSFEGEFLAGRTWAAVSQLKPGADAERMGMLGGIFPLRQIELNEPQIANTETTGAMVAIPAAARHPATSFDFIRLMYTDATLINMVIFGDEGIDFEYVDRDRGIVRLIPSGWDFAGLGWTFGNQFLNYLTEDESPDKWDQFIAFNEAGRPLPSLGFVADRTDPDLQTWLVNISGTRERFEDLFFGLVPVAQVDATFDRLYEELVASGKYYVIEHFQAQFDEWLDSR